MAYKAPLSRIHDNNKAMHSLDPQQLWMHAEDAAARGLRDGQMVLVLKDRGQIRIPVKIQIGLCVE